MLSQVRTQLVVANLTAAPALQPCSGGGSGIHWMMSQNSLGHSSGVMLYVARGPAPPSDALGCAIQDGYAFQSAFAAVYYPPYAGPTLGGTPAQRDYHSELLIAHEIGHVIGGLHELAIPPDPRIPVGGTIMSSILQYNLPRFTGELSFDGKTCMVYGNACRIEEILTEGSPTALVARAMITDRSIGGEK